MKRLMFIMTKLGGAGWGGAHKVSLMLANHYAEKGHEVFFAVSEESQMDFPVYPSITVINLNEKYRNSKKRGVNLLRKMFAFRNICKRRQIDVVVGFTSNMAIYTVLATIFSKRKSLISERTDPHLEPRKKVLRGIRNLIFCLADKVVFQTPGAKEYYPKIVQRKSLIIPNPISSALPFPYHGERDTRIVNFCRIAPQKNLVVLLDAFDLFYKTHPNYTLEIYGDAKEGSAYIAEIYAYRDKLSSCEQIHFYPACKDVHAKVQKAAMFASSSDYEGLSNSMLEAMSIGLPTIVTDCRNGGEKMCIRDGENGIIVPCRDAAALASAMARVADDPELATNMSMNGCRIRDDFSSEVVFSTWDKVLFDLT